jgi:hypothetical protein
VRQSSIMSNLRAAGPDVIVQCGWWRNPLSQFVSVDLLMYTNQRGHALNAMW